MKQITFNKPETVSIDLVNDTPFVGIIDSHGKKRFCVKTEFSTWKICNFGSMYPSTISSHSRSSVKELLESSYMKEAYLFNDGNELLKWLVE